MHILEKYYDLLTEITIANNEVVTIDPDKPYTIVYLVDDRQCAQVTGIIRGVLGESKLIVTIPLDADNVNLANIIETERIVKIIPYSFQAHFENFNNWIGVEVSEKSRIDLRVKFVGGESIVSVEQGSTYNIGYVSKKDGVINYITGTGTVRSIIRSTTKETMAEHINHFTNDIDYILVVKMDDIDDLQSINVIDIRTISLVYNIPSVSVDKSKLNDAILGATALNLDEKLYTHKSYDAYLRALNSAYKVQINTIATSQDVTTAVDNLNKAVFDLKLLANEVDLITYVKDTNTLYCDESAYQIVVEGIDISDAKFNKIKFFTNFGTEKEIVVPGGLNVFWSHFGENVDTALDKSDKIKDFNGFIKRPYNLIFEKANLAEVYLGYRARATITKDGITNYRNNTVKVEFNETTATNVYGGGYGNNYLSAGNIITFQNRCKIDTVYAGNMIPLNGRDENIIAEKSCRISIMNSEVKTLYAGGVNNYSESVEIHINSSSVHTAFLTGKDYATTYGAVILAENSVITQIEYIAQLATSYSAMALLKNSSVYRVVIGCNGANGTFITKDTDSNEEENELQLIIQEGTRIEELMLGANGTTIMDKKYVRIIRPESYVAMDYNELLPKIF